MWLFVYFMMMFILPAYHAVEETLDTSLKYQQALLHKVFSDIDDEYKAQCHLDPPFHDLVITRPLCSTLNLEYTTDGALTTFAAQLLNVGNFGIQWMPPTLRFLRISNSRQMYAVESRHFPKASQEVFLSSNLIFGNIDLRTLPCNLERLEMGFNKLNGRISLAYLPPALKMLDLRRNRFEKHVAYYSNLPKNMEKIILIETKVKVLPISEEFRTTARVIF